MEKVPPRIPEWFSGTPEIRRTPVRPVLLEVICPKCTTGTMAFNGTTWPMNPEGFHHACKNCGYVAAIRGEKYPRIEHLYYAESTR